MSPAGLIGRVGVGQVGNRGRGHVRGFIEQGPYGHSCRQLTTDPALRSLATVSRPAVVGLVRTDQNGGVDDHSDPGGRNLAEGPDRLSAVGAALSGVRRLGVAFSGGVDSAVLLAAAVRVLGPDRVVPILGVSPSLAAAERAQAHVVAEFIGVKVVEVNTHEGESAAYRANGPDRCFHCKDELFTRISGEVVMAQGLDAVAYGENADDARRPDRPGSVAASNHRVLRPLAEAGLTKADVRALARGWSLPCADKPAAPCLASRIPHFEEVTPEKLGQVDRAEAALHALGLVELRVRHHGDLARVELGAADLARAADPVLRARVRAAVQAAGFGAVSIDPAGLQSGAFTLTVLGAGRG